PKGSGVAVEAGEFVLAAADADAANDGVGPAVADESGVRLVSPQAVRINPTINKNTRVRKIKIIPSKSRLKLPLSLAEL
ncbi:MAG: hypothetical protein WCS37_17410, partial [Chloroflexota bacterium]